MKLLLRFSQHCLLTLLILCVIGLYVGTSNNAEVPLDWTLNQSDIDRAKQILHEGSKTRPDKIGNLQLSKEDLNLVINYLLNRYIKSAVAISLLKNQLLFHATFKLTKIPLGQYVNINIGFSEIGNQQLPRITQFGVGKLQLPPEIATFIIDYFIQHSTLNDHFIFASRTLKAVNFGVDKITVTYSFNLETILQAKELLTQNSNRTTLNIYRQKLRELVEQHDTNKTLSLTTLLQGIFALAEQRSTLPTAVEENRIAILAINDYVNKHAKPQFFKSVMGGNRYLPAFLYDRIDLAQHLIGSATLASSINGQFAKILGEEKEFNDSLKGGSGFSFVDLTADRVGTRLGEMAVASPESARQLQKVLSSIKRYQDFMPDPTDLPEHMNEQQFKERYQSTQSIAYQELSKQIDSRIAAMGIYRMN